MKSVIKGYANKRRDFQARRAINVNKPWPVVTYLIKYISIISQHNTIYLMYRTVHSSTTTSQTIVRVDIPTRKHDKKI